MKIAFLTEMGFEGVIPSSHPNMRTEFAWMNALEATHYNLRNINQVKDHDAVFLILPKGKVYLSAEGTQLVNQPNPVNDILAFPYKETLTKLNNKKVFYIQEGPTWWFNDYEISDQINFFNQLSSFDGILAHNEHDVKFYKGLFPDKPVQAIGTLMSKFFIQDIIPHPEDKTIIGGNFAHWYGGFQSYIVAQEFENPIWAQDSHCKRPNEDQLPNLNHFPRLIWNDWIKELSKFKYAIHLMPTIAAGTFSLNCAYFGIPCIGNELVDTQIRCFPELSVNVEDVDKARKLAVKLKNDTEFYTMCSNNAKLNYTRYYNSELWKTNIINFITNA
jgi:hypothetical protein